MSMENNGMRPPIDILQISNMVKELNPGIQTSIVVGPLKTQLIIETNGEEIQYPEGIYLHDGMIVSDKYDIVGTNKIVVTEKISYNADKGYGL